MYTELINQIVKVIIMIAVIIIMKYVVPFVQTHADFKKLALIQSYAIMVVNSAEKLYAHGDNERKLSYASTLLSEMLSKIGVEMTADELRCTIEDAVKTMND